MSFGKVRPGEWLASLCGALILIALFMPWYGSVSAFSDLSLLDVILALVAVIGLVLPLVLARSRYTNVPIVTETFLSDLATIATVVLLLKLIWTPEGGLKAGYYLALIGSALATIFSWRSTSREN